MDTETTDIDSLDSAFTRLSERFDSFVEFNEGRWRLLEDLLSQVAEQPVDAREKEDSRFLKANDLFGGLPENERSAFLKCGERRVFEPGEWVFRSGDACKRVIAVRDGILEIRRDGEGDSGTVALLGVGEVLGMLGVLTGGSHRSSARFPEGGEAFILDERAFNRAIDTLPSLSASLTRNLARRLIGAVQRGDMSRARKRQLEGSLSHFDLATILQSLFASESCAGVLRILVPSGQVRGEMTVGEGRIMSCTTGVLNGREAFQALFLEDNAENRFSFEEIDPDSAQQLAQGNMIHISGAALLMDCVRISDELSRIESGPLGERSLTLKRLENPLTWDEPATRDLVQDIWAYLEEPRNVQQILDEEFCPYYTALRVLSRLMESGCIG